MFHSSIRILPLLAVVGEILTLPLAYASSGDDDCRRAVIMRSNDVIGVDGAGTTNHHGGESTGDLKAYPVQLSNGNFQVRLGHKDGQVLWETGAELIDGENDKSHAKDFVTKLQGDSNLITWYKKGTENQIRLWRSGTVHDPDGTYYLVVEDCEKYGDGTMMELNNGEREVNSNPNTKTMDLCIYDNLPEKGGDILWEVQSNEVSSDKTTRGTSSNSNRRRDSAATTTSMIITNNIVGQQGIGRIVSTGGLTLIVTFLMVFY